MTRFEFAAMFVANHGYQVCGGGGFGYLSDFSAILAMGAVSVRGHTHCVDGLQLLALKLLILVCFENRLM